MNLISYLTNVPNQRMKRNYKDVFNKRINKYKNLVIMKDYKTLKMMLKLKITNKTQINKKVIEKITYFTYLRMNRELECNIFIKEKARSNMNKIMILYNKRPRIHVENNEIPTNDETLIFYKGIYEGGSNINVD